MSVCFALIRRISYHGKDLNAVHLGCKRLGFEQVMAVKKSAAIAERWLAVAAAYPTRVRALPLPRCTHFGLLPESRLDEASNIPLGYITTATLFGVKSY